jgi:hypothetical protein
MHIHQYVVHDQPTRPFTNQCSSTRWIKKFFQIMDEKNNNNNKITWQVWMVAEPIDLEL